MLGIFLMLSNFATYLTGSLKNNIEDNIRKETAQNSGELTYFDSKGRLRSVKNNHLVGHRGYKTIDLETNEIIYDPDIEKLKNLRISNLERENRNQIQNEKNLVEAEKDGKRWLEVRCSDNWQERNNIQFYYNQIGLVRYYVRLKDGLICRKERVNIDICTDYIGMYDKYNYLYDYDYLNYGYLLSKVQNKRIQIELSKALYERYNEMIEHNKKNYDLLKNVDYVLKYNVPLNKITYKEYKKIYESYKKMYDNKTMTMIR